MTGLGLGAVLPLKKPSNFIPTAITGLDLWLDSTKSTDFTYSSGVIVSQWSDRSGNARHLVQASTLLQPSRNGSMNSLTAVRGEGVTRDQLTGTIPATATKTLFFVANKIGVATASVDVVLDIGPTFYKAASTNSWKMWNGVEIGIGSTTTPAILSGRWASVTAAEIRMNGGNLQSIDPADVYSTAFNIHLFCEAGAVNFGDYDIGEVILYNSALSAANQNLVGNYLASKWGITWSTIV